MTRRLLSGLADHGPAGLDRHLAAHGDLPSPRPDALLADLQASGLRGRGGAAFPTAIKAGAVSSGRRPVLVLNGSEGEPMSSKDRVLLTRTPHLVIDGALLLAHAIGAREVILAAPSDALAAPAAALAERRRDGRAEAPLKLVESARGYVSGEETALIAHLEGRPALPRVTPPLPVQRGLRGRPTEVQNVETVAHLALIARHGPRWFRREGTPEHPGTTLVTVSGAVGAPGVYEVPLGIPLPDLLRVGGGTRQGPRAMLVGGYFGAWIDGDGSGITFDETSLRAMGAGVGAGVVVALDGAACPVRETTRLAAWMSAESAGQCGPCVNGLAGLADVLQRISYGRTRPGDTDRLTRWTAMVQGRGACRHPDGVARMIASAVRVFGRELADHARRGPCPACTAGPVLRTPARASAA